MPLLVCAPSGMHLLLLSELSGGRPTGPRQLMVRVVVVCTVPITVPLTHSQVSYTASGIQFQMERKRFPRLYTLQPLVFSYNEAYVHLIMAFGWRRVAIIYQVDPLFSAVRPVGVLG